MISHMKTTSSTTDSQYRHINSRWMTDLNVKAKSIILLKNDEYLLASR